MSYWFLVALHLTFSCKLWIWLQIQIKGFHMRSYRILSNKYIDKYLMLKFYTFWSERIMIYKLKVSKMNLIAFKFLYNQLRHLLFFIHKIRFWNTSNHISQQNSNLAFKFYGTGSSEVTTQIFTSNKTKRFYHFCNKTKKYQW